jgi:thiol-disulfide isomerase/thioredoxin
MKNIFLGFASLLVVCMAFGQDIKRIKITDLEKTIAESKTPLIVNFWATFCKPCVEEIPYFQEEVKKHVKDSVKLLLVSLDLEEYYPAKIKTFATKYKFNVPIVWLDETNADYFCTKIDPKWSGAIPATLFINSGTGYRKFYEEQLSQEKLQKEIMAILGKTDQ